MLVFSTSSALMQLIHPTLFHTCPPPPSAYATTTTTTSSSVTASSAGAERAAAASHRCWRLGRIHVSQADKRVEAKGGGGVRLCVCMCVLLKEKEKGKAWFFLVAFRMRLPLPLSLSPSLFLDNRRLPLSYPSPPPSPPLLPLVAFAATWLILTSRALSPRPRACWQKASPSTSSSSTTVCYPQPAPSPLPVLHTVHLPLAVHEVAASLAHPRRCLPSSSPQPPPLAQGHRTRRRWSRRFTTLPCACLVTRAC